MTPTGRWHPASENRDKLSVGSRDLKSRVRAAYAAPLCPAISGPQAGTPAHHTVQNRPIGRLLLRALDQTAETILVEDRDAQFLGLLELGTGVLPSHKE